MADEYDTTPPGGGTGTREEDNGPLDTTPEGGGTGHRIPDPSQVPAPKPPRAAPPTPAGPKPPPKPPFMTPLRWGILGVLAVGAGVAAWELTPKRGR